MAKDKRNQAESLAPGIIKTQAFSSEIRFKDENAPPKNPRIGK